MAKINITIYKWKGKFWPFKIKQRCGECSLSTRIIKDVIAEFGDLVELMERPWLDNWYKPILRGGWHAPIVMINNKVLSQGIVVDRDILRGTIIKELYKDYKIPKGVHIFTLPSCIYCIRAKKLLKKKKVKYIEHDVIENNVNMQKLLALVRGKIHPITLPQIFINGAWVKGADDLYELEDKGELDRLLR